jgi:hypothetical protein
MRPIGDFLPPGSSTALTAAAKARTSRKASPANSLHAHLGDNPYLETRSGKDRRKNALYQSGTQARVPFRYSDDAPRLDAAFAAQLLGQMMPDHTAGDARMFAAYEEMPAPAQIFDTEL